MRRAGWRIRPAGDDAHVVRVADLIVAELDAQAPVRLEMVASYQGIRSIVRCSLPNAGCLVTDPNSGANWRFDCASPITRGASVQRLPRDRPYLHAGVPTADAMAVPPPALSDRQQGRSGSPLRRRCRRVASSSAAGQLRISRKADFGMPVDLRRLGCLRRQPPGKPAIGSLISGLRTQCSSSPKSRTSPRNYPPRPLHHELSGLVRLVATVNWPLIRRLQVGSARRSAGPRVSRGELVDEIAHADRDQRARCSPRSTSRPASAHSLTLRESNHHRVLAVYRRSGAA